VIKLNKIKICNQCNETLPNTSEYFYHSKLCKDGLERKCKKCRNVHAYKYRKKNHYKILKKSRKARDKFKSINKDKIFDESITMECNICNKEYPMTNKYFYRNNAQERGLKQPCKECYYKNHFRKRTVNNHNISQEEYMTIYYKQDKKCAICGKDENVTRRGRRLPLAIDHAHDTGVIRGLLCAKCNLGIGMFGDNIELMRRAIDYLKNNGDM